MRFGFEFCSTWYGHGKQQAAKAGEDQRCGRCSRWWPRLWRPLRSLFADVGRGRSCPGSLGWYACGRLWPGGETGATAAPVLPRSEKAKLFVSLEGLHRPSRSLGIGGFGHGRHRILASSSPVHVRPRRTLLVTVFWLIRSPPSVSSEVIGSFVYKLLINLRLALHAAAPWPDACRGTLTCCRVMPHSELRGCPGTRRPVALVLFRASFQQSGALHQAEDNCTCTEGCS